MPHALPSPPATIRATPVAALFPARGGQSALETANTPSLGMVFGVSLFRDHVNKLILDASDRDLARPGALPCCTTAPGRRSATSRRPTDATARSFDVKDRPLGAASIVRRAVS